MREKKLRLAAVVPTKNRLYDLIRCIESIIKQYRLPDELIIVDQSQDPGIRKEIEDKWYSLLSQQKLKYIFDPSISGLVHAKLRGVQESDSDIIVFLEDDVILQPDYLQNIEAGFSAHPEMYGCCGVVKAAPKQNTIHLFLFKLFHRGIFKDPRVGIHGHPRLFDGRMIPSTYLSGGLSAYRSEVFQKVRFDTVNGFFMLEDIDFSTRAARVFGSHAFYINTGAILEHAMSPVNRAVLGKKYERKLMEYTLFYKKNRNQPMALPSYIWLMIGLILELVYESIRLTNLSILWGGVHGIVNGTRWRIKPLAERH
jgi:GT2 family glycosyltransferase